MRSTSSPYFARQSSITEVDQRCDLGVAHARHDRTNPGAPLPALGLSTTAPRLSIACVCRKAASASTLRNSRAGECRCASSSDCCSPLSWIASVSRPPCSTRKSAPGSGAHRASDARPNEFGQQIGIADEHHRAAAKREPSRLADRPIARLRRLSTSPKTTAMSSSPSGWDAPRKATLLPGSTLRGSSRSDRRAERTRRRCGRSANADGREEPRPAASIGRARRDSRSRGRAARVWRASFSARKRLSPVRASVPTPFGPFTSWQTISPDPASMTTSRNTMPQSSIRLGRKFARIALGGAPARHCRAATPRCRSNPTECCAGADESAWSMRDADGPSPSIPEP